MSEVFDAYVQRVRAALQSAQHVLSCAEIAEVEHLIQHGEPAEGLRTLAGIIVEENKQVSAETISRIRTLTRELIDPNDLPPDLDMHVID